MKITFTDNKTTVVFTPESQAEMKKALAFPGFLRKGPYFFSPAKPVVLHNLISRLMFKKFALKIDPEISALVKADFKLKPIPESFKFFTTPLVHQEIALRYLYTIGGGGLLLEPGMGKTKVILDFIALMEFKKSVIVCPRPLLFVWQEELKVHRPDKTIYIVKTTDWESEVAGILSHDIVVINYNKAVIFEEQLKKVKVDFIGVDEGLIKDPKSNRTKSILRLRKGIPYGSIMSGTLVTKAPSDICSPIRFLEPALIGESYTRFKDEYAVKVKVGERDLIVGYRRVAEVRSILESASIVMTKKEWLKGLPEKNFFDVRVPMGEQQREVFNMLAANYMATIGDLTVEVDNPLALASKLVQISNGFIYIKNDDSLEELNGEKAPKKRQPKRVTVTFDEQPKMDALINLASGKLKGRRCIIWYNMAGERDIITKGLDSAGYNYLIIQGGEKDVGAKVREFNTNPNISFLLCQAKAVNYGVTILGSSEDELEEMEIDIPPGIDTKVFTQIFYSLNFSLEVYLQQQDRVHRIGQKNDCEYYRLISSSYIDNHIVDTLDSKLTVNQEMLIDFIHRQQGRKE
jgi:SNF2 family DNA or RNA helicase